MSKGKEHKRYEFGTQVSITTTGDSKIMVGAMAFASNKFDAHTLPDVLLQLKRLNALNPAVGLCDRAYKGKNTINDTGILRPGTTTRDTDSAYQALMRKRFRKRAGIEPVMGHLKSDPRLNRSYLKGFEGDPINVLMAAATFNFRQWMRLFFGLEMGEQLEPFDGIYYQVTPSRQCRAGLRLFQGRLFTAQLPIL